MKLYKKTKTVSTKTFTTVSTSTEAAHLKQAQNY